MRAWLVGIALAAAAAARAEPIDDLVLAAELNEPRAVLSLLLKGVDPNQPDSRGRRAIFIALRENSLQALDSLLASPQTHVDEPNAQGETPLMIAAIRGSLPAVQALVKHGAAINREGWTPLHYACSGPDNGVAAWLIEQGAEINARSDNGTTPLMMAARYGNGDLVPMLLQAGAEPRAANEQELTAADFAQRGGRDRIAAELRRISAERQRAADAAK
ncbi:ankyrin repeat domain-containing protein [Pelomonas aquatica]|jgi:ankyrin repeat protein|uniref:Ankyrin repeat domain-containing protein n=1 Tax=Pelomonas aquatica TaxID=431058 RepID=A0A9X4LDR5_9BURK|nr:ankyrin repeat domain-containing protein [Pelomonas aquatica]MCY4755096.1 ankyrin repeat domain-containing protein [Pelomonas aquatica]MDG0860889.1 ankyrin repeat domain-containing protein [Pelomonas aquatica]